MFFGECYCHQLLVQLNTCKGPVLRLHGLKQMIVQVRKALLSKLKPCLNAWYTRTARLYNIQEKKWKNFIIFEVNV